MPFGVCNRIVGTLDLTLDRRAMVLLNYTKINKRCNFIHCNHEDYIHRPNIWLFKECHCKKP